MNADEVKAEIRKIVSDFKPPKCQLVGLDGNVFAIMGRVTIALRRAKYGNLVDLYRKLAMSSDYDNLLFVSTVFVEDTGSDDDDDSDEEE